MLRVQDEGGALTVVSRLARPRVLAILVLALVVPSLWVRSRHRDVAIGLGAAAVALVALGGRGWRARVAQGRVTIRPASPFERGASRAASDFVRAAVETIGEARARRTEEHARAWTAKSGGTELPSWARRPATPGVNDHLRRVVLVGRGGERLPVTAWLPPEDDLEGARAAVEARLA